MKKVLVIQRRMTHYRVPFFETLRAQLNCNNLALTVAYGSPALSEISKEDKGDLSWGINLPTKYLFGDKICLQPFGKLIPDADVIIIAHENKLLYNLAVQYGSPLKRVILWGHGANLQGNKASLKERFKKKTAAHADWWFGYTEHSRPIIQSSGFPADRITVLNNSIDTDELKLAIKAAKRSEVAALRQKHNLDAGPIGIFVGSLYKEKRIEFLLKAAEIIRKAVPSFQLVVVGDGTDREIVTNFANSHPWTHYMGVQSGNAKAELLSLSDVVLNPGLVGLGILDSFVAEAPLITTDCGLHSPEISYLKHAVNGLCTENSIVSFSDAAISLLSSDQRHGILSQGCAESASQYTLNNMAQRFCDGVLQCLANPIIRK